MGDTTNGTTPRKWIYGGKGEPKISNRLIVAHCKDSNGLGCFVWIGLILFGIVYLLIRIGGCSMPTEEDVLKKEAREELRKEKEDAQRFIRRIKIEAYKAKYREEERNRKYQ